MREELVCPIPECRNIPLIKFDNNSSQIIFKCSSHKNINKLNIKDYLKICYNQKKEIKCSNCKKIISQSDYILYCIKCKQIFDNNCYKYSKCINDSGHKKVETNYNKYFDKHLCLNHGKLYNKYCKKCEISFCEKCNLIRHENHNIIEIVKKTSKEIDYIENKIKTLENIFTKTKKIVNNYLNEMEDKIKLKRLILENYKNNKLNGNSYENLNNLDFKINESNKNKIENIFNKEGMYEDKVLSLFYFYLICQEDNDYDKKKLNNLQNELIKTNNNNEFKEEKKEKSNIINLLNKNFKEEQYDENNINRNFINRNHINEPKTNELYKNINSINRNNITEPRINELNINKNNNRINDIKKVSQNNVSQTLKVSESKEKEPINIHTLEKGYSLNSIIDTIIEDNVIYSMIRLNSGNLALGFSNGLIKIYNFDSILRSRNKSNKDKNLLLTIEQFRGRRINYIYEMKDHSLLCCTYSKIHHISLTNNDKRYDYLGLIKLTHNEVSKKIIELGKDLIVSLGEKRYRKENSIKNKSILKIFKNILNPNQTKENEDFVISDSDSGGDEGSECSSLASEWENLYSNEEEDLSLNNDEILMEDEKIKIYKKNKNYDKIYICSIFEIKVIKSKENINIYEFIASSNKMYDGGENCIIIYGVIKKPDRHGYTFFIDKKIENLPCSKMTNSICQLSINNIGIALQKNKINENDGIAVIDITKKQLVKIINGFSIGIINRDFKSPNIFFTTNITSDINKCDQIRYVNDLKEKLDRSKSKVICNIKTRFSGFIELKPIHEDSKTIKLLYFGITSNKAVYIISVNKENL